MSDKLKTRYNAMQNELNASESLIQHTLTAAHPEKQSRRVPRLRTAALVTAVFVLLAVVALPAIAATTGYSLLDAYPGIAKIIKGNMIDDNEGIRLTVESATVDHDTAEIYFSLQDLVGDRIDETTELRDNFIFDSLYNGYEGEITVDCEFLSHETETGKNHYLITVHKDNGTALKTGSRVRLTLGQIITGVYTTHSLDAGFDFGAVTADPTTHNTTVLHWVIGDTEKMDALKVRLNTDFDDNDRYDVLTPGDSLCNITQDIDITAAAYQDNVLRLQVCHSGAMGYKHPQGKDFGKGVLYLVEKNNPDNARYLTTSVLYFNENETKLYEEFFFDIPQEELKNYNLAYWYVPYTGAIGDEWQVTFPLKEAN